MDNWQERLEQIEGNNDGREDYSATITLPIGMISFDNADSVLRPPVMSQKDVSDKEREEYESLYQSIKEVGILNNPSIRKRSDGKFVILDGTQRFYAMTQLHNEDNSRFAEVQVNYFPNVKGNNSIWKRQIAGNARNVETRPAAYARLLNGMLARDLNITQNDLAEMSGLSQAHISQLLKLNNLARPIQDMVDSGIIKVTTAIHLAKLPEHEQIDWIERATTLTLEQFLPKVNQRLQAIRRENRGENNDPDAELYVFITRKKDEIVSHLQESINNIDEKAEFDPESVDFHRGYISALEWVGRIDEVSIQQKRLERDAEETARAQKRAEKETAKLDKKAEKVGIADLLGTKVAQPTI